MAEIVERYERQMAEVTKQPVGIISAAAEHEEHERDAMDEIVTETMRKAGDGDFAVINKQFVRTGLSAGQVTVGDMMTAMPFDHRVQTMEIPVAQVEAALTESCRRDDETSLAVGGIA